MFVAPPSGTIPLVIVSSFHLLILTALTLIAGLTMMIAGTHKKVLRWKKAPQRCPACGRRDRYNCPCRR